jgi:hypothetical protein
MQVSTCLLDAYEDCNGLSEVSFFVLSKARFYIKLKKTATEILKCWNVRTVKNVYLQQVCLNGRGSEKGDSRENAEIADENNVDCIVFILKALFVTNLCGENRL